MTPNDDSNVQYREVGEDGGAVVLQGFVTGSNDRFTLWFDPRFAKVCEDGEHDAFMLSGQIVDRGTIDAEGLSVVLSGLECLGFCPGTWAHSSLTLDRLGDCPSCDEIAPTCNGELVPVCSGNAPTSCGSSSCGQVLGCYETTDCAGSAPSSCGNATPFNPCSSILGCYGNGHCTGTVNPCFVHPSSFSCGQTDGCYWNAAIGECEGDAWSCAGYSYDSDCYTQSGCSWDDSCDGTPTPCSSLGSFSCEDQSGCYLDTDCVGTPTPCEELSPEGNCESQPGCDAEWVPP